MGKKDEQRTPGTTPWDEKAQAEGSPGEKTRPMRLEETIESLIDEAEERRREARRNGCTVSLLITDVEDLESMRPFYSHLSTLVTQERRSTEEDE